MLFPEHIHGREGEVVVLAFVALLSFELRVLGCTAVNVLQVASYFPLHHLYHIILVLLNPTFLCHIHCLKKELPLLSPFITSQ